MKIDKEDADEDEYKGGFLSLRFFPVRGEEVKKLREVPWNGRFLRYASGPARAREREREGERCANLRFRC